MDLVQKGMVRGVCTTHIDYLRSLKACAPRVVFALDCGSKGAEFDPVTASSPSPHEKTLPDSVFPTPTLNDNLGNVSGDDGGCYTEESYQHWLLSAPI